MTTMTQPPAKASKPWFDNAAQWHTALGEVPLDRIVFDPRPGLATEQDLLRFVEVDKRLCELIDGTLVEKPVGAFEALIAMRLGAAMTSFADPQGVGVVLGADATLRMFAGDILLPDVTFIRTADLPGGQMPAQSVPKLRLTIAVEVLSPGNTAAEMRRKTREYFESGAELVWRIDPRTRTAAVYTGPTDDPAQMLAETDSLDGGTALPGFSVALSYLFRGPARPASDQG